LYSNWVEVGFHLGNLSYEKKVLWRYFIYYYFFFSYGWSSLGLNHKTQLAKETQQKGVSCPPIIHPSLCTGAVGPHRAVSSLWLYNRTWLYPFPFKSPLLQAPWLYCSVAIRVWQVYILVSSLCSKNWQNIAIPGDQMYTVQSRIWLKTTLLCYEDSSHYQHEYSLQSSLHTLMKMQQIIGYFKKPWGNRQLQVKKRHRNTLSQM